MPAMPFLLPDLETLDPAALKAMICLQHAALLSHKSQIERLELLIAKLRRMQFGRSSEKVERQIEQLELKLEELEANHAELAPEATPQSSAGDRKSPLTKRRALPEHLPREVHEHLPEEQSCSVCKGRLKKLGEDVSEMLEYLPASFKVVRHVRPRMCCATCDRIVQAPAPSRPIARGMADRACSLMSSRPSSAITYRTIASRRSMPVKASSSIVPRWPDGLVRAAPCWLLWSRRSVVM
jgi:transposase